MSASRLVCRALAATVIIGPIAVSAQVRASERASISQVVDGSRFTIEYSRPRARGRAALFGRVIPWGEVWTPGANWATTLEINRDVSLDGHPVKRGKYSVWFVVREGAWTVVLDPRANRYHEERPDSTADQVRWNVQPVDASFTEVLTWSFPEVRADGTQLLFQWGNRRLGINATVAPSHAIPISAADAAPFVGTYDWKWADSTTSVAGTIELYYEGGMLRQRYAPFPSWYPLLQGQPMVRINSSWFIPAIIRDGKVWEMVADLVFEFKVVDGVAVSFELRDDQDTLMGGGVRQRR